MLGSSKFDRYLQQLERITWHYDEPVQFYNSPLLANLCGVARKKGLKVLLSGEGSDEIFFGYDRFLRTSAFLVDEADRQKKLRHLYFGGGLHSIDVVKELTERVSDGAENTASWKWLETYLDESPDLLQQIFSQKFRLQMLLQRQDRIGMADSIEIRVPFLRPELVKWSNKLPVESESEFGIEADKDLPAGRNAKPFAAAYSLESERRISERYDGLAYVVQHAQVGDGAHQGSERLLSKLFGWQRSDSPN